MACRSSRAAMAPTMLSSAAAATLAATVPPARLLAAVGDWTVEGNMPRKRKPSASVAGRKGAVAACAATPSSAMATKQKARLPACSFQLRLQCSTSRSEERRVGKEGVRTGKYRWSPYHDKKILNTIANIRQQTIDGQS